MRIRTQLIVAAFLLAVVPLGAIVIWSYHSSRRALESAYRSEADRMTRQMDSRLAMIRSELDQRMTYVSALPMSEGGASADVGSIVNVMGDTASLVDALEYQPLRPVRREPVARSETQQQATQTPPATPPDQPVARPRPQISVKVGSAHSNPEAPAAAEAAGGLSGLARLEEFEKLSELRHLGHFTPIVIDLPAIATRPARRFVMSEEQKALMTEISELGKKLGSLHHDDDAREEARRELQAVQDQLKEVMTRDLEAFNHTFAFEWKQEETANAKRKLVIGDSKVKTRVVPQPPPVPALPQPTPPVPAAEPVRTATPVHPPTPVVREATERDAVVSAETARRTELLLGRNFEAPLRQQGEVVGQLTARVSPEEVVRRILGGSAVDGTEVPFAIDKEGSLYTRSAVERQQLEQLGIAGRIEPGQPLSGLDGWIVSTSTDPESGLRIGVARPVGENLKELRKAAGQNFAFGLGLIAFALIGIVPLSNHLTRDVKLVTEGAERIAQGDLMTRLPVKTSNELGQLARAFNQMASDLSLHQEKLVEQERNRKESELQQRLLAVEYERKSFELEEARRFQLSMLPKEVPHPAGFDVAVLTKTATEVGGDYYDFHVENDVLSVTIGDATGHGAKAGTMVTVVKTLFAGYTRTIAPAAFLHDAAERIRRMDLGRMAMALSLARFEGHRLTFAAAGMPPLLIHHASSGRVEEIALEATPLGTFGDSYPEVSLDLEAGDTVLFLTDGFPELMNADGQQIGYPGALEMFRSAASAAPDAQSVIDQMARAVETWHGELPPNDDVTFVTVRLA
jgi:serine phosphatase RsbU (regulator of sigma subunit)